MLDKYLTSGGIASFPNIPGNFYHVNGFKLHARHNPDWRTLEQPQWNLKGKL
jgi:hypothetical protein